MSEVHHGDAVELVRPGLHELTLDLVAASIVVGPARREGAGRHGVCVRGWTPFGEPEPFGKVDRVLVAEAEFRGSYQQGGLVGDLEGEQRGSLVVRFGGHEAHRLVQGTFADDPRVLDPVLFVEPAVEVPVQGEEDIHDGRISVRMDSPGPKSSFENPVHDHLTDFCGHVHHPFCKIRAGSSSRASVVSTTGFRLIA